jgi:hypothetical protein
VSGAWHSVWCLRTNNLVDSFDTRIDAESAAAKWNRETSPWWRRLLRLSPAENYGAITIDGDDVW